MDGGGEGLGSGKEPEKRGSEEGGRSRPPPSGSSRRVPSDRSPTPCHRQVRSFIVVATITDSGTAGLPSLLVPCTHYTRLLAPTDLKPPLCDGISRDSPSTPSLTVQEKDGGVWDRVPSPRHPRVPVLGLLWDEISLVEKELLTPPPLPLSKCPTILESALRSSGTGSTL